LRCRLRVPRELQRSGFSLRVLDRHRDHVRRPTSPGRCRGLADAGLYQYYGYTPVTDRALPVLLAADQTRRPDPAATILYTRQALPPRLRAPRVVSCRSCGGRRRQPSVGRGFRSRSLAVHAPDPHCGDWGAAALSLLARLSATRRFSRDARDSQWRQRERQPARSTSVALALAAVDPLRVGRCPITEVTLPRPASRRESELARAIAPC